MNTQIPPDSLLSRCREAFAALDVSCDSVAIRADMPKSTAHRILASPNPGNPGVLTVEPLLAAIQSIRLERQQLQRIDSS